MQLQADLGENYNNLQSCEKSVKARQVAEIKFNFCFRVYR
jgi:hypothetical protein